MAPASPNLFLDILADRTLRPAAVRLRPGSAPAAGADLADAIAALEHLAHLMPCVLPAGAWPALPDEVAGALRGAGCAAVAETAIASFDAAGVPALPPGATHVAGAWYLHPPAKPGGGQQASRVLALQLLQLVAADADTRDIEAILRHDPSLAYHLLRLVNSLDRAGKRITSFAQAILILGRQQLRRWLNLVLFAARKDDPRAPMLTARASVRARAMELLARAAGLDKARQEAAFMAGMFSLLGALFGLPLAEVLRQVNIGDDMAGALLRGEGELGTLLAAVVAAENADAAQVADHLGRLGLPATALDAIGIDAVAWMHGVLAETGGNGDA